MSDDIFLAVDGDWECKANRELPGNRVVVLLYLYIVWSDCVLQCVVHFNPDGS